MPHILLVAALSTSVSASVTASLAPSQPVPPPASPRSPSSAPPPSQRVGGMLDTSHRVMLEKKLRAAPPPSRQA